MTTENTNVARVERQEIDHAPEPQHNVAPIMMQIERIVMDPSVPIERLEQMLALKERMEERDARKAFDRAIAEAKSQIKPILKKRKVSHDMKAGGKKEYMHEDLAAIAEHVDPILADHGLSYRYRTNQDEHGKIFVTCIVSHRDGYSEETTLSGGKDDSGNKNAYQAVGSAVTYLQRYTLKAALGLSAAHDDDGKKAEAPDLGTISPDQFTALRDLMEQAEADEAKFLSFFKLDHLGELPVARFGEADAILRKKLAAKEAPDA